MSIYFYGPLETTYGRVGGLWESAGMFWSPNPTVPAYRFGDALMRTSRLMVSDTSLIDFVPAYWSDEVYRFLVGRGACLDGAACWAGLPPPFVVWQTEVFGANAEGFPHEHRFLAALRGKFKAFRITVSKLPDLEHLKVPARTWGLT